MSSLQEIETAISQLSKDELTALRIWFAEFDAEIWDRQFEEDRDGDADRVACESD